jgi:hypothetical protein
MLKITSARKRRGGRDTPFSTGPGGCESASPARPVRPGQAGRFSQARSGSRGSRRRATFLAAAPVRSPSASRARLRPRPSPRRTRGGERSASSGATEASASADGEPLQVFEGVEDLHGGERRRARWEDERDRPFVLGSETAHAVVGFAGQPRAIPSIGALRWMLPSEPWKWAPGPNAKTPPSEATRS